jgi:hypothetical protein
MTSAPGASAVADMLADPRPWGGTMVATGIQVVIDCSEPAQLAAFWAQALGYVVQLPPEGHATWEAFLAAMDIPEDTWGDFSAVVDPDGVGPRIYLQRVPEGKVVKNRIHLDLNVGWAEGVQEGERRGRVLAEVERLSALGATVVREVDLRGEHWVVMQDPEGNEFCVQ